MKRFAITGVSGYVAPRHLRAIKETGNDLVAAIDPHDSAGIMDSYFAEAGFFTEFERFDRHLEMLRRQGPDQRVEYLAICSPNHLHDAHIRLALRLGANAICEKPIVLNPWNLDALQELEQESEGKVYTVLQLRLHPSLIALRERLIASPDKKKRRVTLTYITARGKWYEYSWKGNPEKSGGIATNIGIHFFDLLLWLFGGVQSSVVHLRKADRAAGFLELENAEVRWFLSINGEDLPQDLRDAGKTTHRSIRIDDEEIEFSDNFADLHTRLYAGILVGRGFGIADARPSIELVHAIRTATLAPAPGEFHPFLRVFL